MQYKSERGLDIAISEYAPGRSVVIDKNVFLLGGIYYGGSEMKGNYSPARKFMEDQNYVKSIYSCDACGWFGLDEDRYDEKCPRCKGHVEIDPMKMVRPWGFAPINGKPSKKAQVDEEYSWAQAPEYSTVSHSSDMGKILGYRYVNVAVPSNQRIIMRNKGVGGEGFLICQDCGAAVPGDNLELFNKTGKRDVVGRPYRTRYRQLRCNHRDAINCSLGFDFVTDMLVLEIELDSDKICTDLSEPWLNRALRSLAETLRLQASVLLDVEITEINAGYRLRRTDGKVYVDIYLYDSLSSGAGYSSGIASQVQDLLHDANEFLINCDKNCNCASACHKCIKHYRNTYYHHDLDRHSALELLNWLKGGAIAENIPLQRQQEMLRPLIDVLSDYDIEVAFEKKQTVIANMKQKRKYELEI